MKHNQLIILTRTAVLAALIAIATMVIPIPIPGGGYANAGDIVILITAFVLGPVPAAFAAGFGSVVADLLLGYSAYAPGTLLVKGLAGLTAGLVFLALERRSGSFLSMLTAGIAGVTSPKCINGFTSGSSLKSSRIRAQASSLT